MEHYTNMESVGTKCNRKTCGGMSLSDKQPLRPQLDNMVEAAGQVTNAGIDVKDQLLFLMIINSLPKSYSSLAATILATVADVKTLKPNDIIPKIIEEEQRCVSQTTQISRVS